MLAEFKEYHSPITHLLDGEHGMSVAKAESEVTLEVLRLMGDQDIAALPIHDSLIVEKEYQDKLCKAMQCAYTNLGYTSLPVIKVS